MTSRMCVSADPGGLALHRDGDRPAAAAHLHDHHGGRHGGHPRQHAAHLSVRRPGRGHQELQRQHLESRDVTGIIRVCVCPRRLHGRPACQRHVPSFITQGALCFRGGRCLEIA